MALRVARAATGRAKLLRFRGHFHGWHDHMAFGVTSHFDGSGSTGVLPALAGGVVLADPGDVEGLVATLDAEGDAIAAAIVEPTGSSYGQVPLSPEFLHLLRQETARRGIVLIFDEVVTGFRVARGGAQQVLGIVPDLTTLAKILAGGLPGGALIGRRDLLELLDPERAAARGVEKIGHQGTYNANPVSAAAGIATLEILRDTDATERALDFAAALRSGINDILAELGIPWAAYGTFTGCHIFTNPRGLPIGPRDFDPLALGYKDLKLPAGNATVQKLRLAMRLHGVDLAPWPGGPSSAAHEARDLDQTLEAFRQSLRLLRAEGELGRAA
jgi:glutamate-1-semialdehyde 2,1-aminomutase